MGVGTTAIAAIKHHRNAIGIDKETDFLKIARQRVKQFSNGKLKVRASGKAVSPPRSAERVAQIPEEWKVAQEAGA
jgi:DNA modification methylase